MYLEFTRQCTSVYRLLDYRQHDRQICAKTSKGKELEPTKVKALNHPEATFIRRLLYCIYILFGLCCDVKV